MWPLNKFQLYENPSAPGTRFVGGSWFGNWSATWPLSELYVNADSLILKINYMFFKRTEYSFSKEDITKLQIITYIPIIGVGLRIYSKNHDKRIIFWYWSFKMKNLILELKNNGWADILEM